MPGILHGCSDFASFACCIYRNDLALFQDICGNVVKMNDELKKEMLSFKVHSCIQP